ncbi:zinc-binding dehydrogenase [Streptomyces sp. DSM 110735]|uniref:quinone oxidoreductase family protein n=1 Tax=Streptomyces sp. DSM 110735 TaxID=2775031 RepID=UPI0027DD954F|nr:zinc-binding dehydrogenase [Streptomyces sp. DSM 110735]
MRAVVMERYGGPEVLEVRDVPEPGIEPEHRRIEVTRSGVNFADLLVREDDYLTGVPLPFVPGNEVVGRSDGERVAALMRGGGYAQVSQARLATAFPVPDDIDDDTALALTLQGQSAWHLLHTVLQVRSGETVIVPAAAGGIGSLAVQLAKRAGARVVAMAGSPEKRAFAAELGADAVVDSRSDSLADDLAEAAGGGANAALEMTGGDTLRATMDALAPLGRMAVYGGAVTMESPVNTRELMSTGKSIQGFWLPLLYGKRELLTDAADDLFAAVRSGDLRVPPVTVYPLTEAARAQEDLRARRTVGKVALDPAY